MIPIQWTVYVRLGSFGRFLFDLRRVQLTVSCQKYVSCLALYGRLQTRSVGGRNSLNGQVSQQTDLDLLGQRDGVRYPR